MFMATDTLRGPGVQDFGTLTATPMAAGHALAPESETAQPLPDAFTCPTCLDVFLDPCTVVPCGHSFCRTCLTSWLDRPSGGGNTRCPLCGLPIEQAVLSYALRAATEAAYPEAIRARRAMLHLQSDTPQESHFHRVIVPPASNQRTMEYFIVFASISSIGAACVGVWWAIDWQLFAISHMELIKQKASSAGVDAEQGDELHAVSAASRSVVSYGLLALLVAGVLIWSSVRRAVLLFRVGAQHNPDVIQIVEAVQQRVEDAVGRLARLVEGLGALILGGFVAPNRFLRGWTPAEMDAFMHFLGLRLRVPDAAQPRAHDQDAADVAADVAPADGAAVADATRVLRLLVGGWFVLFILFFIVLQREILQQLHLLPRPEDVAELGAAWAGEMPQMIVHVFVVTFAAVFTVLFSWQVLAGAVAQLRQ